MTPSRITLFMGHYGSGKTNLAVNYAVWLKAAFDSVSIADLDIVNPYFRTKDSADLFTRLGIEMIASRFANTNLEAPAMPAGVRSIFDNPSVYGVIDVGGDDAGALAVGQYAEPIAAEKADVLLVCSQYRPLSRTAEDVRRIRDEIEDAARIRFTGLVNNSNLGARTTAEDVLSSMAYARAVSKICGLPLRMTSVREELLPALSGRIPDLFGLTLVEINKWRI